MFEPVITTHLLRHGGRAGARMIGNVDIFGKELLLAPVHSHDHWWLLVIAPAPKVLFCLDSSPVPGNYKEVYDAYAKFLAAEHQRKFGTEMEGIFKVVKLDDVPKQSNGYDCGMFVCQYAEHISRNAPFSFRQGDMDRFRIQVAFEITVRKLLTTPEKNIYRPKVEPVSDDEEFCLYTDAGLDGDFDSE
jgi:sentrin-specific protease 1